MKLIKLTAVILSALLLLCSCGNAAEDGGDNRITRENQTEETLEETKTEETLGETEETSIETTANKQEDTIENANKNAELVFERVAIRSAKLFAMGEETALSYFDLTSLNEELIKSAGGDRESFLMLPELTEGFGGVYITVNTEDGVPITVVWASSLDSKIIGVYPEEDPFGTRELFGIENGEYSFGEALKTNLFEYAEDNATDSANANAKLVFQNTATYMTKVQIAGASMDSLLISGSLSGERTESFPDIRIGEDLTGEDLTYALRYYMGGENAGVYVVLLDELYNPVGTLWAADEETSVVGAYPIARRVEQNESGNINTADVYAAAFLD
jgi:hypothetical protein